jgi:hypothetical protein
MGYCFANLKGVLDMRPIYHQTNDRVQAHIYVAALGFLLHRAIEKKLKAARLDLSATEAFSVLKSVRVLDNRSRRRHAKRSVATLNNRAAAVLRAIGISALDPPTPPTTGPNRHVVTNRHADLRKINGLRDVKHGLVS